MSDETTQATPPAESRSAGANERINRFRDLLSQRKKQAGNQIKSLPGDMEVKGAIADLIKASPLPDEAFPLLVDAPPDVVAEATGEVWRELDPESRHQLIVGWLKQRSEKAVPRQVAIAGRLARQDGDAAADLLRGVITRGTKDKLSEDKTKQLRNHFFFNPTEWIDFHSSDKEAMKTVVAAFIPIAAEINDDPKLRKNVLSYRFWRDFVAWAAQSICWSEVDDSNSRSMIECLRSIARRLPDDYRYEVESLINESAGPTAALDQPVVEYEEPQRSRLETPMTAALSISQERDTLASDEARAPEPHLEEEPSVEPIVPTTETSSAIVQKRIEPDDPITAAELFIGHREAEIEAVKSLIDSFRRFQQSEAALKKESEEERQRAGRLAIANASLDTKLNEAKNALRVAEDRASKAKAEYAQLREELSDVKGKLDEAHRRIDREVSVRLDDFRGKLKVKLFPILENKRTTDRQEPNPKLAESLRHLFRQLEEELNEQGIKVS